MSTNSTKRQQIVQSLKEKENRDAFVGAHVRQAFAFQILMTRQQHGLSRADLAERAGLSERTIARLEDPNSGRVPVPTLLKLAAALDIACIVRFGPYSELVDWEVELSPEKLAVPSFNEDTGLCDPSSEPKRLSS